jgi:processive 1,2-diacylglycerol beta-glucosyltransferase
LDERLLPGSGWPRPASPFGARRPVIGCMGTMTHDNDLRMILPALQAVWRRHPETELQMIGMVANDPARGMWADLPVRQVGPLPEENEYPLFMVWFAGVVHWDIALAPLEDDDFNRCKSDIKFLDYSAIGAAGIFSRVPAYASSVDHRQTGWLAENTPAAWEEALETLLTDIPLREQIAHQATSHLFSQRILARRAPDWRRAIEELLGV